MEEHCTTEFDIVTLQELHKTRQCCESHLDSHVLQTQPQAQQMRFHHHCISDTSQNKKFWKFSFGRGKRFSYLPNHPDWL
jgi:hypothetical protein